MASSVPKHVVSYVWRWSSVHELLCYRQDLLEALRELRAPLSNQHPSEAP